MAITFTLGKKFIKTSNWTELLDCHWPSSALKNNSHRNDNSHPSADLLKLIECSFPVTSYMNPVSLFNAYISNLALHLQDAGSK